MSQLWGMLLLTVALCLDGFGVGVSYGMRRIGIPLPSLLVICLTSAAAMGATMVFGRVLGGFFPAAAARQAGAFVLIAVGFWLFLQPWFQKVIKNGAQEQKLLFRIPIPPLGVVIQIMREPVVADLDRSGEISLRESALLGAALAMDAFGAGFGAALAGTSLWICPLMALVKLVLVRTGQELGKRCSRTFFGDRAAYLPGLIIIALGLLEL